MGLGGCSPRLTFKEKEVCTFGGGLPVGASKRESQSLFIVLLKRFHSLDPFCHRGYAQQSKHVEKVRSAR